MKNVTETTIQFVLLHHTDSHKLKLDRDVSDRTSGTMNTPTKYYRDGMGVNHLRNVVTNNACMLYDAFLIFLSLLVNNSTAIIGLALL